MSTVPNETTAAATTAAPETTKPAELASLVPEGTTAVQFNFRNPQPNLVKANAEENLPAPIKRASVVVGIKMLTSSDLIEILTSGDPAARQLLVDQANQVLADEVRSQLDDLPNYEEVNLALLDMTKVDFTALANTPKDRRSNGGITDEVWAAWEADFKSVLIASCERTEAQVKTVHTLLTKKLKDVSKNEEMLNKLKGYLDNWLAHTTEENQNTFGSIYLRLDGRITTYLQSVNVDELAKIDI